MITTGFGYDELAFYTNALSHVAALKVLALAGVDKSCMPRAYSFYDDEYIPYEVGLAILELAGAVFSRPENITAAEIEDDDDLETREEEGYIFVWLPIGGRDVEALIDVVAATIGESVLDVAIEGDYLRLDFYLELKHLSPYDAACFYAQYQKMLSGGGPLADADGV